MDGNEFAVAAAPAATMRLRRIGDNRLHPHQRLEKGTLLTYGPTNSL